MLHTSSAPTVIRPSTAIMLFNDAVRMLVASAALSHAQAAVNLGTAGSFGALAPASVSNTGGTVIMGDVGTKGTSVTGFPPGVYTGTLAVANGVADQAQIDSTAAFTQGQGLPPSQSFGALASLAGLTLEPGVYSFDSAVTLDGTLTLSGPGTYVIQIGSSLTTGSGSMVDVGQADGCSVYWIVTSSATIGTTSSFAGNILAGMDITLNTLANVQGGLYAGSAIVLDNNKITACGASNGPANSTVSSSAALPMSSIMPSSTIPANTTSIPATASSAIVPNNATSTAPTFASSTMHSNATSIAPTFASSTMRSNATTSPSPSSASPSRPASMSGYFNASSTVSNPSSSTAAGLPGTGSIPHGYPVQTISTTTPIPASSAPAHSDCTESTTTTSAAPIYEECEETTTAAAPLPTVTEDCEEAPAVYAVTTSAGAPGYGPPPQQRYPQGYPHRY